MMSSREVTKSCVSNAEYIDCQEAGCHLVVSIDEDQRFSSSKLGADILGVGLVRPFRGRCDPQRQSILECTRDPNRAVG